MPKLRELILDLAVRGKLVEQDPNDEPALVLLERIEQEKQRLYKDGKIGKPKSVPVVKDSEKPHELPKTWAWTRLLSLFDPVSTRGKQVKTKSTRSRGHIRLYHKAPIISLAIRISRIRSYGRTSLLSFLGITHGRLSTSILTS